MIFTRRILKKAIHQSHQSYADLDAAYIAAIESVGKSDHLDDNELLAQIIESIIECKTTMASVDEALIKVAKPSFNSSVAEQHTEAKSATRFDEDAFDAAAVSGTTASNGLKELYEMVLDALSFSTGGKDKEQLFQTLKQIESCRDQMLTVSNALVEISTQIKQRELQVLYAPPSYFNTSDDSRF